MSQEKLDQLLIELKTGLFRLYRNQLAEVYLYGSYARGEQDSESDLDILIVLTNYERYSAEIDRTAALVSSISLKYGVSISTVFLNMQEWGESDTPLLRNIRVEGVAV